MIKLVNKMVCISTRAFDNDPQDDQGEPEVTNCGYCGDHVLSEELCPVPSTRRKCEFGHWFTAIVTVWCCSECYDEVCDEEGFNPEEENTCG